jgi:hypothetical protein
LSSIRVPDPNKTFLSYSLAQDGQRASQEQKTTYFDHDSRPDSTVLDGLNCPMEQVYSYLKLEVATGTLFVSSERFPESALDFDEVQVVQAIN